MTVDLSTARVGSEVTTRAGAKLVIAQCIHVDSGVMKYIIVFEDYPMPRTYRQCGEEINQGRPSQMDIIAISPPPMSDAERLVEIVKICRREKERAIGAGVQCLVVEILDVAEGRSP